MRSPFSNERSRRGERDTMKLSRRNLFRFCASESGYPMISGKWSQKGSSISFLPNPSLMLLAFLKKNPPSTRLASISRTRDKRLPIYQVGHRRRSSKRSGSMRVKRVAVPSCGPYATRFLVATKAPTHSSSHLLSAATARSSALSTLLPLVRNDKLPTTYRCLDYTCCARQSAYRDRAESYRNPAADQQSQQ